MSRSLLILAIILVLEAAIFAQPDKQFSNSLRKLYEQKEFGQLLTEVHDHRDSNPKEFQTSFLGYLYARAAESDRRFATSTPEYLKILKEAPDSRRLALRRLASIAGSTGNLIFERLIFQKFVQPEPANDLDRAVTERMARNRLHAGQYEEAIRQFTALINALPKRSSSAKFEDAAYARELWSLMADAYSRNGQTERAADIYRDLINNLKDPRQPDDPAYRAVQGIDVIEFGSEYRDRANAASRDEFEHLKRAQIYQFNRDFSSARFHFQELVSQASSVDLIAEAIYQIGREYSMSSEHSDAVKWYERLLERYPDSTLAPDTLLQAAASYARIGKPKEAVTRYQNFIEKYKTDPKLDRAYLNLVDINRDLGEDQEALKWATRTADAFPGMAPEPAAMFASVRIRIAREEWKDALELINKLGEFSQLGGASIPGGTYPAEVAFLKGQILENLELYREAIAAYLAIPDGQKEYYGWRAKMRLTYLRENEPSASIIAQILIGLTEELKSKDNETKRRAAREILRLSYSNELRKMATTALNDGKKSAVRADSDGIYLIDPRPGLDTTRYNKLAKLGLHEEAADELETQLSGRSPASDKEAFLTAEAFVRGNRADLALVMVDPLTRKMPSKTGAEELSKKHMEILYPVVFQPILLRESRKNGIDPRLILAIMKQESGFQVSARSSASARGLMQFIPATALRVSNDLGRTHFDQAELYSPSTAIVFGLHYLGRLFKEFPGQPEAVVASYNGGSDNMKRWLARSRSRTPERYVPEIMFTQTKDYVYRVMSNYWVYQSLYHEDLSRK